MSSHDEINHFSYYECMKCLIFKGLFGFFFTRPLEVTINHERKKMSTTIFPPVKFIQLTFQEQAETGTSLGEILVCQWLKLRKEQLCFYNVSIQFKTILSKLTKSNLNLMSGKITKKKKQQLYLCVQHAQHSRNNNKQIWPKINQLHKIYRYKPNNKMLLQSDINHTMENAEFYQHNHACQLIPL